MMLINNWGTVIFGIGIYTYFNQIQVLYWINSIYLKYRELKQSYFTNIFEPVSYCELSDNSNIIALYTYTFQSEQYKIIAHKNKLNKQPYTTEYIQNLRTSTAISMNSVSKESIISAYLMDDNNISRDYLSIIHELCGPLGDFYKNTSNQLTAVHLKLYIKHTFPNNNFTKLIIMRSNGNESDLLSNGLFLPD
jgi:hypothetical protein